ncbi:MAG: FtsW/RodA/SpoVE family cell cycle protein, partial [Lachnospiraceae bacterium]|nr:FtsW/RodA/SpoVE family cell cycle protein [Lachnospiraceae bacterium]
QPAEFVKISFIFFVAGMLYKNTSFTRVCITTVLAAAHVLILVISKDLGAALIFFVVYLIMLFVATKNVLYIFAGTGAGALACVIGYRLFAHVRVRYLAWQNPLEVIDKEGYQISQSLFAIGTGGWKGLGLYKGTPEKIPVVAQDFIFSAISEEFGGIFAICLILLCLSCFLLFLKISMEISDQFHRLVALGLGTLYGFQVFLTIGGVTNFIPSTGVTLPLVSYGGSSILSSIIIFAIIQGLYILKQDEGRLDEKRNSGKKAKVSEKITE